MDLKVIKSDMHRILCVIQYANDLINFKTISNRMFTLPINPELPSCYMNNGWIAMDAYLHNPGITIRQQLLWETEMASPQVSL
jgi:hypothetical protein